MTSQAKPRRSPCGETLVPSMAPTTLPTMDVAVMVSTSAH